MSDGEPAAWVRHGKVRARLNGGGLDLEIEGVTTQAKYYKPLVREFFRKHMTRIRPAWGDFQVSIRMEFIGEAPLLDLDNLAKALLDSVNGVAFHDDSQVARLCVERAPGERDRISLRAEPIAPAQLLSDPA